MTSWRHLHGALPWLLAPALAVASCGRTDESSDQAGAAGKAGAGSTKTPTAGAPGRGGSEPVPEGGAAPTVTIPGISDKPKTVTCGGDPCSSVTTLAPGVYVDPCCVDDVCGVSSQLLGALGGNFQDACQAKNQPGELDVACPDSPEQVLPVMGMSLAVPGFAGCCRAETGTCGVVVDKILVGGIPLPFASPNLGCVDSAPFFADVSSAACGSGSGGSGSGGAGGAESTGGAGGEAGASPVSAGGAG